MKREMKKKAFIVALLILFVIIGFSLKQNVSLRLAASKEGSKEDQRSDIQYINITEEEKTDEESKPVEPSNNEIAEANMSEEEIEDLEEVSKQDEVIEEEESITENEAKPTVPEEEASDKSKDKKKEETQKDPSKTTKVVETIEKSNVGMIEYFLPSSNSEERMEKTTHVVLHFTSNALNNPQNPYLIEDTYNIFKDYGVSAHYVIGRSGEIYSFVPEDRIAYHAGRGNLQNFPEYNDRLNHYSIGIEILAIGTREEMTPIISAEKFDLIDSAIIGYTEAQYNSLNILLNDLVARYPGIEKNRNHIVGHDEYSGGGKTDPGSLFNWSKIGL